MNGTQDATYLPVAEDLRNRPAPAPPGLALTNWQLIDIG